MKLSTYQENLLKKIPSVEKRRDVRSDMKSLTKEIRGLESIMRGLKGRLGGNRKFPIPDYWEKKLRRKHKNSRK